MTSLQLSLTRSVKVIFSPDEEGQVIIACSAKRQSMQQSLILKNSLFLKRRLALITNVMFSSRQAQFLVTSQTYICIFGETLFMRCTTASSGISPPNFLCNLKLWWFVCLCTCPIKFTSLNLLKVARHQYLSQHTANSNETLLMFSDNFIINTHIAIPSK